jgi:MOSC domain-containing protein YiiM
VFSLGRESYTICVDWVRFGESAAFVIPSNPGMKLISVNVGLPREVESNGGTVKTGIFKQAVAGTVRVERLNLVGDRQADLSVHGGPYKAVYAYPAEHYAYWQRNLAEAELPWGMFGENLTTDGLRETDVRIGDRFRIGTAELSVTQPRTPCYKLGIRFARPEMVKLFLNSGRSGFYFAVAQEGELKSGDSIELVDREANSLTVAEINRLYAFEKDDREMLKRAVQIKGLSENWRNYFLEQLQRNSN